MNGPIRLREHEDHYVSLNRDDVLFLARELRQRISVRRDLTGDGYILNSTHYVGVISLPSGHRLECAPKVPIQSVFAMLAVAYDLPSPFRDEQAEFSELDDLLDFVAAYFADLVEQQIQRGLYRSYVDREDNLAMLRGRISVADDVRQNYILRHRTYCRFAEFTWDVPENQIIRQVVHLLSGWVRQPRLRHRLLRLDQRLAEVTPTHLTVADVDRVVYHRLNDAYRPIHRLCRLFLSGASLSEVEGTFQFRTFLLDMNRLFEAFVTQVLRAMAPSGVIVNDQVRDALGHDAKVPIRVDLAIERHGVVRLIADCKYKRSASGAFHPEDVYQVLAYCTGMRVSRGAIIYPADADTMDVSEVRIRNSPVRIWAIPVDLTHLGTSVDRCCEDLSQHMFGWMQTSYSRVA